MKSMQDVFGGGGGGGSSSPLGDMGGGGPLGLDDEMGMEDEMGEPGGGLEGALASAGYTDVTPEQIQQIEAILGTPGMGEMGEEDMFGEEEDMGLGGMPDMPM